MEVAARARNIIGATPLEPPVIDTEAEQPDAEAVMEETDGQRQRPRNRRNPTHSTFSIQRPLTA
jgi:hypothetical protein